MLWEESILGRKRKEKELPLRKTGKQEVLVLLKPARSGSKYNTNNKVVINSIQYVESEEKAPSGFHKTYFKIGKRKREEQKGGSKKKC